MVIVVSFETFVVCLVLLSLFILSLWMVLMVGLPGEMD